ncbi:hypothetical protein KAK06_01895 [Ideonella sp. 4Y11]|uniref:Uncharacterized protein n=1 Tax=Ideonella aquatica TaxID=2824119 RepID=A0A940YEA5_9BURK|nr:hypothetical protein [Ideonella aquatica]MBQ0957699.1 hypothetical protein [Ideonella aquatica]
MMSIHLNLRQRDFLAGVVHRVALLYALAFVALSWQRQDGWLMIWYLPLWLVASNVAVQLRKELQHG